ncbi:MAG: LacI family DNA-binding transcriptional regulator [Reichenbachiella sp.]
MITIKEIAKQANVSIGTVDRVLHNRGRVAEDTKNKVMKIAKEGNYTSNVYARHLKLNKTYTIAVVLPEESNYWSMQKSGIEKGFKEYASLGFKISDHSLKNSDESALEAQIQEVIAQKPEGIIVAPTLLTSKSTALQALKESGIPFVFVDCNIPDAGSLTFVGQDASQSGKLAGQLLVPEYHNECMFYIVSSSASDLSNKTIASRIEGFKSYCTEFDVQEVNLERDGLTVAQLEKQLLEQGRAIHMFIPTCGAHGILSSMASSKEALKLCSVGYDLTENNTQLLEAGTVSYIIHQKPAKQGYTAVQALYKKIILQEDVPETHYMPIDIVTQQNLGYSER